LFPPSFFSSDRQAPERSAEPVVLNLRTVVFFSIVMLSTISAAGQVLQPPDPDRVRVRMGPLWLNPTLALTNAGIDTNVFNQAEDDSPKRDFTMTVSPRADLWLRMGRTWIVGNVREDVVWFRRYSSERSVNGGYTVGWLVPLTRLSFNVGASWLKTRERPGFEIDARSERHEKGFNGALEVRALSKTLFGGRGARQRVDFDKDALFLGTNLRSELTRINTTGALTVRHELTPLTSVTLEVGTEQDRFEFSPLRDSDSTRVEVGVRLDPFALINGTARVGFRNFEPRSGDLPGYRGTTAQVDLGYVARGSTRVSVQAIRDIQYSFDINQPYYLQMGVSGGIGQHVFGPMDVEARAGAQRLSYRTRAGVTGADPDRVDRVRSLGIGVGYRLGRDLRVGINVDQQKRISDINRRQYEGLRYGAAVTYVP
jgi:hypothetical protein